MIKNLLILLLMTISSFSFSQAPQGINYQAIVRNSTGAPLNNTVVGIKISIRQGSAIGPIVYDEAFNPTTNDYGLVNLVIGQGIVITGTFSGIDWGNGPYFVELSADENGGTNYTVMGTQQLMSVPYALYAENAGGGGGNWSAPTVTTGSATMISATEADIQGTVNPNGLVTQWGVQSSLTPNFSGSAWPFQPLGSSTMISGNSTATVAATVSGPPNSTIYYRVGGINAVDTTFGNIMSFNTAGAPPTVNTGYDSLWVNGDHHLYANINPNGSSTTAYIEYGLTLAYGNQVALTPSPMTGINFISGEGIVPSASLAPNSIYYYRAVATNAFGTTYGINYSFYNP